MPNDIDDLMRSIAIHEAGHAVAGMALGMRIMYICIYDCICMPHELDAPERGSFNDMLFTAAGYVAEELFLGEDAMFELERDTDYDPWGDPGDTDRSDGRRFFDTAAALRKTWPARQRLMLRALADVREMLQAHARDVEAIAAIALERGRVDLCNYKLSQ